MTTKVSDQQISCDAAMLAIDWKTKFAQELRDAARQAARGADTVTVSHYHQALPGAIEALVQHIELETAPTNARKEAASRRAA